MNGAMHNMTMPSVNGTSGPPRPKMMMHMSFFWGTDSIILFTHWPGSDPVRYAIALVLVFVLAVLVEWLSHCKLIRDETDHVVAGSVQTLMHGIGVGLNYTLMLAVMSFNVGIFLVAILGHAVGFLLFGSRVFKKDEPRVGKTTDIPPMSC